MELATDPVFNKFHTLPHFSIYKLTTGGGTSHAPEVTLFSKLARPIVETREYSPSMRGLSLPGRTLACKA